MVSKKSKIIFFTMLIIGIILISLGSYEISVGMKLFWLGGLTSRAMGGVFLTISGVVITGFDIIGGTVVLIRSRRKE